jgi:hypothetical protein
MPDEFDPYKPGSGLKSDFDGWIKDGVFTSEQYGTVLILMTDTDDGEEYPVRYAVGSGWDTFDGGETVQHPAGARQLFAASSGYSDFMVFAMDNGAKDVLYLRVKDGLGPRHAGNYNGLGFHWDMVERPTRRPKLDEEGQRMKDDRGRDVWENGTVQRLLPVRFLGVRDVQASLPGVSGATSGVSGVAAPASSASTSSDSNSDDPLTRLDLVTAAKVRKAARTSGDYITFVDVMLELTDGNDASIMEYDVIKEALADENWYASLHKGEE